MISSTEEQMMLQVSKLMFGSQVARYKACNNLRGQGYSDQLLARLNRKGELKTGIVANKFYVRDRTGHWRNPHQPRDKADPNKLLWVVTFQLTVRSQFMISGQASIGVAIDDEGNVGIYINGSLGGGIGVGVQGGIEGSIYPGMDKISELKGVGNIFGGYIGVGAMASGEINSTNLFGKKKLSEKLKSIGISISPVTSVGVGGGVFFEASYTNFLTKGKLNLSEVINMLISLGVSNKEATELGKRLFHSKRIIENNF